ncbi:hypothetical protein BC834DRAFT_845849 [Gloeopeniophorella convolvens]|nr:hypothetical protein BC834DRAFT_845849 [Gloeopeniophorella convolvens]
MSIATAEPSQFALQTGDVYFGYELPAPQLEATSQAQWEPVEQHVTPYPVPYAGQYLHQTEGYHAEGAHEPASGHRLHQQPEPRVYMQKPAQARHDMHVVDSTPYPAPYVREVARATVPGGYTQYPVPAVNPYRHVTSGFVAYNEYSQAPVASHTQSVFFDEPPPAYPSATPLHVHAQSDLLIPVQPVQPRMHALDAAAISPSPLAPRPTRHSSFYHVLKHESPASPALGMPQPSASSIAHALSEPQEQPYREAPPSRMLVRGYATSAPNSSSSGSGTPPISHVPEASGSLGTLPRSPPLVPTQAVGSSGPRAVSPRITVASQRRKTTRMQTRARAHASPDTSLADHDAFPRLRKLQPALPVVVKEEHSAASSPLSSIPSRPPSSAGTSSASAPAATPPVDAKAALEAALSLPLFGRKRPVLRAKLACLFCRRRKIQCRPVRGDPLDGTTTCQQCAKRCRECEYPEMNWRGRGKKRAHDELESDGDEGDEDELVSARRARCDA